MAITKEIKIKTTFDGTEANRGINNLERNAGKTARAMENLGKKVGQSLVNVGRNLTTFVTLPLAAAGIASLKLSADFETGMNRVQAVTGATADEFKNLREQAALLGGTTQFTAKQAADAMGFLAMAGFEANEVLGAMPGTLQLAAAGAMDLAQAADISSNILTGYRMETDQLIHANDVLVKTFTSTNTNLQQLGEAMKFVAPIASAANVEFEETAAVLGLLGNAGIQASMAGTTLRGAINALINPTSQEQQAMDALGVSALDAANNLIPLHEVVLQLEQSGAGAAEILEIFGLRAGPGMAALVSQGSEALRELTQELRTSQGVADEIAKVQMEGLNGAMLKLKSAAEGLLIAVGDTGLLDSATEFVTSLAEWTRNFAELTPFVQKATLALLGLAAAIGPLVLLLGQLSLSFLALRATIAGLAGAGGVAAAGGGSAMTALVLRTTAVRTSFLLLNPVVLAVAGSLGVLIAAVWLFTAAEQARWEAIEQTIQAAEEERAKMVELGDEIDVLRDTIDELIVSEDDSTEAFERTEQAVVDYLAQFPELIEALGLVITWDGHLVTANGEVINSLDGMQEAFNEFSVESLIRQLNAFIEKTRDALIAQRELERQTRPSFQTAGVQTEGIFRSEEGEAVVLDAEGITETQQELADQLAIANRTQEETNQLLKDQKIDEAIELLSSFLDVPIIAPPGGGIETPPPEPDPPGGRAAKKDEAEEPTRAEQRVQEWLRIEDQINQARRLRITQLENLTALGLTEEEAEGRFRSTIQSAVQSMGVLNEEQELSAGHLEFMNLWLGFLGLTLKDTAELLDPVGDAIGQFDQLMFQIDTDMDVARRLGTFQEERLSFIKREITAVRNFVNELENFRQVGLLTPEQQNMLTGLFQLVNVLTVLAESLGGDDDDDIDDTVDDLTKKLASLNDNFQIELAENLSRFIQNWMKVGGSFDTGGFLNSIMGPIAQQWAGDIVKQIGAGVGFIDPIAGVIAGLAGFAINRIFGGDKPLEIEQPLDIRIVDVSADVLNTFNFKGLDPFTFSSRFRGVFENGLYG